MRHRVTILNHEPTHDEIIKSVNSTHLELGHTNYTREDRYTMDFKNRFKNIKQLRVSIGHIESDVFHYNSYGLTIYAVPNTSNKYDFFNEINPFINNLFKTKVQDSNWILSRDALLLHLQDFQEDGIKRLLSELTGTSVNTQALELSFQDEKLTFSFINQNRDDITKSSDPEAYEEIGIFLKDENSTPEDIILSGVRVVLGEEQPLYKTLFHVKPQFRPIFTHNEIIKNGLHPKLKTSFTRPDPLPLHADIKECKLYYYLTLNRSLFIDKYNLGENFKYILNFGNSDLELPEYKIQEWGNEILLEVTDWSKELVLNLHSRYQLPSGGQKTSKTVFVEPPIVFFGCDDTSDRNTLQHNPFINQFPIGNKYGQFFTNNTIFYEAIDSTVLEVDIPIPNKDFELIGLITSLSLSAGLIIIILQLLNTRISKRKVE